MELLRKKWFRNIIIILVTLLVIVAVWKIIRMTESISCQQISNSENEIYSENDSVLKAISLSYLVYGCETCDDYMGTVNDILDNNKMGIVLENFGIVRKNAEESSTALFDTSEFIRKYVGEYRLIAFCQDESCSFYGAAFCDDDAKCVWIVYTGSVSFRDAIACAEVVLNPRLSCQEKDALGLYETVLNTDEVQNQSYQVMLTGHSLGGTLASLVACGSGCRAITINGADGIAIDKYRGIESNSYKGNRISNYMTSPEGEKFSFMNLIQRLMFLGDYKGVEYHVYEANGYTTDTHCAFSFIEYENGEFKLSPGDGGGGSKGDQYDTRSN